MLPSLTAPTITYPLAAGAVFAGDTGIELLMTTQCPRYARRICPSASRSCPLPSATTCPTWST